MTRKITSTLFFIVALCASTASAQTVYTPAQDSAARRAILNALRAPVEKELKQKIQFSIENFKVQGAWAFVSGEPQNSSGGEPNYQNTPYENENSERPFDNNIQALLKKTGGKWKVVVYAVGCTDVCWFGWDEKYKAPKAIFTTTE